MLNKSLTDPKLLNGSVQYITFQITEIYLSILEPKMVFSKHNIPLP